MGLNVLGCRADILGQNEAPSEKQRMAYFSIISGKTFHNGVDFVYNHHDDNDVDCC